jgi:UDP-glucose 4-epimerase
MVTGATTSLGAAIVEHLLARDDVDRVLAIAREPDSGVRGDKLIYRAVDLRHARDVHDLVWGEARTHAITHVIHGCHHRRARDTGAAVHAQNVESTRQLLLACAEHPTIHRFIYRSFAEVYSPRHATPDLIDEEAPIELAPDMPQWLRDRVEADLAVCTHLGGALEIAVLRLAEILAPNVGSQLWDYLSSRVCLRPLGFDPMLNALSLEDAADAFGAALSSHEIGVYNIPGYDTLPLSRAIAESVKVDLPVPGPLLAPLYRLRRAFTGFDFHYELNARRFHFGGVLDGSRARGSATSRTPR